MQKEKNFYFSTAFDIKYGPFDLGMDLIKIASFSLTNFPLIGFWPVKKTYYCFNRSIIMEDKKTIELIRSKTINNIITMRFSLSIFSKDANEIMDTLKKASIVL